MTGTSKLMNYEAEAQKETKKKKNQEPAPVKEQVQAQAVTNVVAKKKFVPEKVEEKKINVKDAFSPSTLAWIKKENLDADKILKAKELMDRGPDEVKTKSKGTNLEEILSQKEWVVVSLLYKDKKDNKLKMNESTILAYHSKVKGEKKAKEAYAIWKDSKNGKEIVKKSTDEINPMEITSKVSSKKDVVKKETTEKETIAQELNNEMKKESKLLESEFFKNLYGPSMGDYKSNPKSMEKLKELGKVAMEKSGERIAQRKAHQKEEPVVKKETNTVPVAKENIEKNKEKTPGEEYQKARREAGHKDSEEQKRKGEESKPQVKKESEEERKQREQKEREAADI